MTSDRGPPQDDSYQTGRQTDDDLRRFLNEALVEASGKGDGERARSAIAAGASVHYQDEMPIRNAAANGHTEIVRLLLAAGADKSVHHHKPLRDAEANGHIATARALREAGSYNPDVIGDFERSVAERAAREAVGEGSTPDATRESVLNVFKRRRDNDRGPA